MVDVDYSQIYDSDGNWQQKHKRAIIHVMDSFRISHEAYHELRHAGRNHLPPLHHIINEKFIMSEEIPYTKHPTVSVFVCWGGVIMYGLQLMFAYMSNYNDFFSLQDDAIRRSVKSVLKYLHPPPLPSVCI